MCLGFPIRGNIVTGSGQMRSPSDLAANAYCLFFESPLNFRQPAPKRATVTNELENTVCARLCRFLERGELHAMRSMLGCLLFLLVAFSVPLNAQIEPIPNLNVQPIPLPGGDIFPPYGLYNQFFPGPPNQNPPFDPMNADPQGITNFRGITAMGYTSGFTTDQKFAVVTDIRVYQGDYIGGEVADPNTAGATRSARAHGTFVEI